MSGKSARHEEMNGKEPKQFYLAKERDTKITKKPQPSKNVTGKSTLWYITAVINMYVRPKE